MCFYDTSNVITSVNKEATRRLRVDICDSKAHGVLAYVIDEKVGDRLNPFQPLIKVTVRVDVVE